MVFITQSENAIYFIGRDERSDSNYCPADIQEIFMRLTYFIIALLILNNDSR